MAADQDRPGGSVDPQGPSRPDAHEYGTEAVSMGEDHRYPCRSEVSDEKDLHSHA